MPESEPDGPQQVLRQSACPYLQVVKASYCVHAGTSKGKSANVPTCADLRSPYSQVVKASSRVHGGGTEYKLQLKAAQGDMPATTLEVASFGLV